jgi:hypothetical protein
VGGDARVAGAGVAPAGVQLSVGMQELESLLVSGVGRVSKQEPLECLASRLACHRCRADSPPRYPRAASAARTLARASNITL